MNENLIPLNERTETERKEIQAMGGRATKGLIRISQMKCKKCKLPCLFKDQGIAEGWTCKVPNAKRAIIESQANPNKLNESILMDAMKLQTMANSFDEVKEVLNAKLNIKKTIFPETDNIRIEGQVNIATLDINRILEIAQKNAKRAGNSE